MRADRLISLLLLLQAHGQLTAPELARRLEVSVRTVFRDMEALSAAGFPVYAERGRAGGCALLPGFRTDVSGLTAAEAQALFVLTGGGAASAADLGLSAPARSALQKLAAGLPAAVRPNADQLSKLVLVDSRGWLRPATQPESDRWLGVLREAVLAGSRVRLRYASQRGTGNHLVDPWGLVSKAGIWYLVAAQRGKPRMYRVSRVAHVSVLAEPAARPPDLDLPAVWEQLREEIERPRVPPVRVTLRVRNDTAALVRRLVEPQLVEDPDTEGRPNTETADARDRADGPGWRRWVVTFRSLRAASGTLLGFGDAVEVLAPAALRTEMREVAAAVVRLYDGSALGVPDLGVPDLGISDD